MEDPRDVQNKRSLLIGALAIPASMVRWQGRKGWECGDSTPASQLQSVGNGVQRSEVWGGFGGESFPCAQIRVAPMLTPSLLSWGQAGPGSP